MKKVWFLSAVLALSSLAQATPHPREWSILIAKLPAAKSTAKPTPKSPAEQCLEEFTQEFDEAVDASERAQATEAYSYRLQQIPHLSSQEKADQFLNNVATRVNAHPAEAGMLLVHCEGVDATSLGRAKEKNLLVPEALESIRSYASRLVAEYNQERDAAYRHEQAPPKTTLSQSDQLQPGWAYRQGKNQYLILERTNFRRYRVEVQEFQTAPDPKKPQSTPNYALEEATMTGEELMRCQRIKYSAEICSQCKGTGSLKAPSTDKFSNCTLCKGSGLIVSTARPTAPVAATAPSQLMDLYTTARQAFQSHKYAEAIRLYQQVLALPGLDVATQAGIHNDLGTAFSGTHNTYAAMTEYNKSLAINPKQPVALYNRAMEWAEQGNYKLALQDMEAASRCAKTPQQSQAIQAGLQQIRQFMSSPNTPSSSPAASSPPSGSSQGMGGWNNAAELQTRMMETLERQRRENAARASQHPNRKY